MTRPVVHPTSGSISFPLASLALPMLKVLRVVAIDMYTVADATSLPGQWLPIRRLSVLFGSSEREASLAYRRPNPNAYWCGSVGGFGPKNRSGLNVNGSTYSLSRMIALFHDACHVAP